MWKKPFASSSGSAHRPLYKSNGQPSDSYGISETGIGTVGADNKDEGAVVRLRPPITVNSYGVTETGTGNSRC